MIQCPNHLDSACTPLSLAGHAANWEYYDRVYTKRALTPSVLTHEENTYWMWKNLARVKAKLRRIHESKQT